MRKVALLAAAALGGLWVSMGGAVAQSYPYCAVQGGREGYETCAYPTFESCWAAVRGVGGFCQQNPRFVAYYYDDPRPMPRRERRPRY